MNDHTTDESTNEIPYGYCHCGCGQKTKIAKYNSKRDNITKGEPLKFLSGHSMRKRDRYFNPNPSGLCLCGCGQPTPIAKITRLDLGHIKGYPTLYVNGHTSRMTPTIEERFWKRVDKLGPDECWEWQGSKHKTGHGIFAVGHGAQTLAHRYSYELHKGSIPEGMNVCHRCDNGACVNPSHLFLGTHADNVADMVAKGRHRPNGGKLVASQVIEIRQLFADGMTQTAIAKRFGIGQGNVSAIVLRKNWKHI